MPLNNQAGYKVLFKTTLNILVDRALMHHISFLSVRMIYALMLDRFTRHNNLCKKSVPDLALYAICVQIDILVFEGRKETEEEKN